MHKVMNYCPFCTEKDIGKNRWKSNNHTKFIKLLGKEHLSKTCFCFEMYLKKGSFSMEVIILHQSFSLPVIISSSRRLLIVQASLIPGYSPLQVFQPLLSFNRHHLTDIFGVAVQHHSSASFDLASLKTIYFLSKVSYTWL